MTESSDIPFPLRIGKKEEARPEHAEEAVAPDIQEPHRFPSVLIPAGKPIATAGTSTSEPRRQSIELRPTSGPEHQPDTFDVPAVLRPGGPPAGKEKRQHERYPSLQFGLPPPVAPKSYAVHSQPAGTAPKESQEPTRVSSSPSPKPSPAESSGPAPPPKEPEPVRQVDSSAVPPEVRVIPVSVGNAEEEGEVAKHLTADGRPPAIQALSDNSGGTGDKNHLFSRLDADQRVEDAPPVYTEEAAPGHSIATSTHILGQACNDTKAASSGAVGEPLRCSDMEDFCIIRDSSTDDAGGVDKPAAEASSTSPRTRPLPPPLPPRGKSSQGVKAAAAFAASLGGEGADAAADDPFTSSDDETKSPVLPPRKKVSPGLNPEAHHPHGRYGAAAAAAAAATVGGAYAGLHPDPPTSTATTAKKSLGDRLHEWTTKAGAPINKLTNRLGSEAWWPMSLDKECTKAGRILTSFCASGFYTGASGSSKPTPPSPGHPTNPGPASKAKVLIKIPQKVLVNAHGVAIFTVFRAGLQVSGASGSGVVVARLPNGDWSPPSGILVHTIGAGFMAGVDIYDCVCILNTAEAVQSFSKPRLSLGGELSITAGPIGTGGALEAAIGSGKPVWSYMKSRGIYAGAQVDGTIILQRPDANAAYYGEKATAGEILRGEVAGHTVDPANKTRGEGRVMWPEGANELVQALRNAEGKPADRKIVEELGSSPTPGDLAVEEGVHRPAEGVKEDVSREKGTMGGYRYA